jgi:hypothetical protein
MLAVVLASTWRIFFFFCKERMHRSNMQRRVFPVPSQQAMKPQKGKVKKSPCSQLRGRSHRVGCRVIPGVETKTKVPNTASRTLCYLRQHCFCLLQVMAALSVSLGSMIVGFASAYTSPALESMDAANSTVHPDLQQVRETSSSCTIHSSSGRHKEFTYL